MAVRAEASGAVKSKRRASAASSFEVRQTSAASC